MDWTADNGVYLWQREKVQTVLEQRQKNIPIVVVPKEKKLYISNWIHGHLSFLHLLCRQLYFHWNLVHDSFLCHWVIVSANAIMCQCKQF